MRSRCCFPRHLSKLCCLRTSSGEHIVMFSIVWTYVSLLRLLFIWLFLCILSSGSISVSALFYYHVRLWTSPWLCMVVSTSSEDLMLLASNFLIICWYFRISWTSDAIHEYLPGIILLFILHLITDCFSSIFKISYCYFHAIWSSDAVTASSWDHIIVLRIICTSDVAMNILRRSHCRYCVICAQSAVYEHLHEIQIVGTPLFRHGMPFLCVFLISHWVFASFDHIMFSRACPWYHNVVRAI